VPDEDAAARTVLGEPPHECLAQKAGSTRDKNLFPSQRHLSFGSQLGEWYVLLELKFVQVSIQTVWLGNKVVVCA